MKPRLLVLWLVFSIAMAGADAEPAAHVISAFEHLNSEKAMFPDGRSATDRNALEILRAHPEESKELLIATLSKNGRRGRPDADSLLTYLVSESEKPEVIRRIVASYSPGDPATPFLGYFAFYGEEQDMQWLVDFIAANPDSVAAMELAKGMIEGGNSHALNALRSLVSKTSGKWRDTPEVRRFLSESPLAQNARVSTDSNRKEPVKAAPVGTLEPEAVTGNWLRWGLGTTLFILGVAFYWFKRHGPLS